MIVGFTGTSDGMTLLQKTYLVSALANLGPEEFHHGDCVGADAEAHDIVRKEWPRCKIVIHPPENDYKRAFKAGDEILEPRPYLVRNKAIVARCEELVAAPKTLAEELRSGTWATIRTARRCGKLVHLLRPV